MVKAVFKQTAVGEIPEEWDVYEIGNFEPFVTSGSRGWAKYYSQYGSPFVRITNMERGSIQLDLHDLRYVRLPSPTAEGKRTALQNEDILISITADIGICSLVSAKLHTPAYINQHIALVRFQSPNLCPRFVSYYLNSREVQKTFVRSSDQGAKAGMNLDNVRSIKFAVPKYEEQKAIADALSDVDALIGSLEKLIAKKHDIKTGTMQQLLTGKKRLPGYYGKWTSSKLGEIGQFRKGKGIRKNEVLDSGLPCVRYGEIYTRHRDYIKNFYSFISPAVASEASIIKAGDLLFAGSGETSEEIGKCVAYLSNDHAFAGGDIVIYRAPDQDAKYLGFLMNHESVVVQKMQMGQGDAVVHIHAKNIAGIEVCLPPIDEQQAISDVLSDMDFEIGELENRLTKTKAIKQGMMQELLTGRTRLV